MRQFRPWMYALVPIVVALFPLIVVLVLLWFAGWIVVGVATSLLCASLRIEEPRWINRL